MPLKSRASHSFVVEVLLGHNVLEWNSRRRINLCIMISRESLLSILVALAYDNFVQFPQRESATEISR